MTNEALKICVWKKSAERDLKLIGKGQEEIRTFNPNSGCYTCGGTKYHAEARGCKLHRSCPEDLNG